MACAMTARRGEDVPGASDLQQTAVKKVVVHPLVLLSVVDHFNRINKLGSVPRVVGVLLGSLKKGGVLDISNSFAVPFEEDDRDPDVWYLDHNYLESMYAMFKKVNAREKVVGWYHTGPKLRPNDIAINELLRKYQPHSVLVIIDAEPRALGLPTDAYIAVEEVHDDGTPTVKTFEHIPSEIEAEEAEEVGVEHLLRDIKDTTVGTLSQRITNQLMGLRGLLSEIQTIQRYLGQVVKGERPVNHPIMAQLQDVFNLLPDVELSSFVTALHRQTNDQMLVVYLAAIVRSIIALHNLIDNKINNREEERKEAEEKEEKDNKKKEEKEKKEEEKKDGEKKKDKDEKKEKDEKKK